MDLTAAPVRKEKAPGVLVDEAQCRGSGIREFSLKENSTRTGRLPHLVFLGSFRHHVSVEHHRGRGVAVNGNSVFTHLRDRQLFPRVATPLHISTSSMPCNCSRSLSTLVTVFFRTGILVGVKQYPIVTLICISLVTNVVKHPSIYTGYCIFFLWRMSIKPFVCLKTNCDCLFVCLFLWSWYMVMNPEPCSF